MSTDIVKQWNNQTDPRVREQASEIPFIPQIKLCNGMSKAVKDRVAQIGDFVIGDEVLGPSFRAVIGPDRPTALEFDDQFNLVAKSNDLDSETYASIRSRAKRWARGCSYGPEFLLYLPDVGRFALYHFARMSLRESERAYSVRDTGQVAEFASVEAQNKHRTPVPKVSKAKDQNYEAPEENKFTEAAALFFAFQQEQDADDVRPR